MNGAQAEKDHQISSMAGNLLYNSETWRANAGAAGAVPLNEITNDTSEAIDWAS